MSDESRVLALIGVKCARCARKYGQATLLGEMSLWPESLGGGWRWSRADRIKIYPDGRRATQLVNADAKLGGGSEARCRRCGSRPRFRVKALAARAEETQHAGGTYILL